MFYLPAERRVFSYVEIHIRIRNLVVILQPRNGHHQLITYPLHLLSIFRRGKLIQIQQDIFPRNDQILDQGNYFLFFVHGQKYGIMADKFSYLCAKLIAKLIAKLLKIVEAAIPTMAAFLLSS